MAVNRAPVGINKEPSIFLPVLEEICTELATIPSFNHGGRLEIRNNEDRSISGCAEWPWTGIVYKRTRAFLGISHTTESLIFAVHERTDGLSSEFYRSYWYAHRDACQIVERHIEAFKAANNLRPGYVSKLF
jgi:hypothetical protein